MMTSVLVGYATGYGSTQEVADAVAAKLRESGHEVDIQLVREVKTLAKYDAIVLGAPLFMFKWHKDAHRFLSRHRKALTDLPVAVFALGPVQDPHNDQEWEDSWGQLKKEFAKYPWLEPVALELFGGKYAPEKLRFPLKMFAGSAPATDIRDWAAIRAWAGDLAAHLEPEG